MPENVNPSEDTENQSPQYHTCICGATNETVLYISDLGNDYCSNCLSDFIRCESCNGYINPEDAREHNHNFFCENCFNNYFMECSCCEVVIDQDASCRRPDDSRVCIECFNETCYECETCGRTIWTDDARWTEEYESGPYCGTCFSEYKYTPSKTYEVNKSTRKVGFELEFASRSFPLLNSFGKLHNDGSLDRFSNAYTPREFSSFIYNGDALLTVIDKVIEALENATSVVNRTCGFHVHLDVYRNTEEQRKNIREWWRLFEPTFMAMTSESRRHNQYCKRTKSLSDYNWKYDRYATLNIAAFEKYNTYEFRLHQGTLDSNKIKNWIMLLLSFVDTFSEINAPSEGEEVNKQYKDVLDMSDRERLIFFFHQLDIPFSMRKYIIHTIKHYEKRGVAKEINLKKIDLSKKSVKSILQKAVYNCEYLD